MPINRFYTPSRGQYISQFVPKELPADLMLKGVLAKQQKYDVTDAAMGEAVTSYKPNSLEGEDTRYAKAHKKKLEEFVNNARGEDLASPEFQRRYRDFVNEFKNDEGMQKVEAAYAHHQKALARMEEIRKKGPNAEDQAYLDEYQRTYGIYTDENGQGFKGDVGLADNMFKEGQNIQTAIEDLFNHVGKDSYQSIAGLSGSDLHYSVTNGGVSVGKLNNAAAKQLHNFVNSAAGDQLKARFNMMSIPKTDEEGRPITQAQYLSSLSPEDKKKFEEEQLNYIKGVVTGTGQTFATSEHSSNLSTIMNKQSDRDRQDKIDDANIFTGQLSDAVVDSPNLTWQAQLEGHSTKKKQLYGRLAQINKAPERYAPGAAAALKAQIAELDGVMTDLRSDVHSKYKTIYDRNLEKVLKGGDPDSYLKNLSSDAKEVLNNTLKSSGMNAMNILLQQGKVSKEEVRLKQLELLSKSPQWKKLDATTKQELMVYSTQMEAYKAKKASVRAMTDAEVNDLYYSGNKGKDIEYMGYTTVPKFSGSVAELEEKTINTVKDGYKFYTPDGKEIPSKDLTNFKMGAITQKEWKGQGYGRVGTVTKTKPGYYNEEGKWIKPVVTQLQVVVTSMDPNRGMGQNSYAKDYITTAKSLYANGKTDQAQVAERTALDLVNPDLAAQLNAAESSKTFNSGVMPVNIAGGRGNIKIDKKLDGTYSLSVMDNGRVVTTSSFNDIGALKEFTATNFGR